VKRTTRSRLRQWALYVVLLLLVLLVVLAADWAAIRENFFDPAVAKQMWPGIVVDGAKNTVVYTFLAFIGGLGLALVLALMKLSPAAPYRWLATSYVEFFRGLPALLVIIMMALAVPLAFGWAPPGGLIGAGVIALVLVSAAYMAETLRAGIQAVPKGQVEAARSLGMGGLWTTVSIVLPQAFRIVIPPLTNEFVLLLKDSSLLAIIGATAGQRELTTLARDTLTETSNATPLTVAAIMYLVITLPLTRLEAWMERRTQRAR